jgi:hypothetical protein
MTIANRSRSPLSVHTDQAATWGRTVGGDPPSGRVDWRRTDRQLGQRTAEQPVASCQRSGRGVLSLRDPGRPVPMAREWLGDRGSSSGSARRPAGPRGVGSKGMFVFENVRGSCCPRPRVRTVRSCLPVTLLAPGAAGRNWVCHSGWTPARRSVDGQEESVDRPLALSPHRRSPLGKDRARCRPTSVCAISIER